MYWIIVDYSTGEPMVCMNEVGLALTFETEEEAQDYASEELQLEHVIVEIPG